LAVGDHPVESELPLGLQGHSTGLQPYQVLRTRMVKKGEETGQKLLIQW